MDKRMSLITAKRASRRSASRPLLEAQPGQAIVIIALVMVVLLGFTALAIDGGGLYFLRRDAQNAADAAALAALLEICNPDNIDPPPTPTDPDPPPTAISEGDSAAKETAEDNGFKNGINGTIVVANFFPASSQTPTDVAVTITAEKPARLVQVVYKGPLEVTVTAQGHCVPHTLWTHGAALYAIGTCDPGAIDQSGSSSTVNGGVFSNGGTDYTGSSSTVNGSGETCGATNHEPDYNPPPVVLDPASCPIQPPAFWNIDDFAPGGKIATSTDSAHYYSHTGNVTDWGDFAGSGHPKPGVYYVNGDVTLGPSDFSGVTSLAGVTLVATGKIDISLTGSSTLVWSAYDLPSPVDEDINMPVLPVIFSIKDTPCGASGSNYSIGTTGQFNFTGAIYAPLGVVSMSFPGAGSLDGAILAESIDLSGSDFTITYNPKMFPPAPPDVNISGP
jgi:hypothetical protein